MIFNGGVYVAVIPKYPAGTIIKFKVYTIDSRNHSTTSSEYEIVFMEITKPFLESNLLIITLGALVTAILVVGVGIYIKRKTKKNAT